ncbi:MAG TPA: RHS repeat domain-containing protein [Candidatus Binataceae bacterium]|nr:RHS repeat domain-containing protein [Candidatus Binataceae bacterium]
MDSTPYYLRNFALTALSVLFLLCVATPPSYAQTITYGYDPGGRLISVANGAGCSATYTYDPVGNLKQIQNSCGHASAQPARKSAAALASAHSGKNKVASAHTRKGPATVARTTGKGHRSTAKSAASMRAKTAKAAPKAAPSHGLSAMTDGIRTASAK